MIGADAVHLSVVATSRNDNHGGALTQRMQHFVDGFVAQCKRHGLRAELILVEWNPPPERAPLLEALAWPADPGPCDIRIITVPAELHRALAHSDQIPLFQMIAKNAGIRRARGEFVLATNIDILFSDEVLIFLQRRLRHGVVYLADRVDVPADVPASANFSAVLAFCGESGFRLNGGSLTIARPQQGWRFRDVLKRSIGPQGAYLMNSFEILFLRTLPWTCANPGWAFRRIFGRGRAALGAQQPVRYTGLGVARTLAAGVLRIVRDLVRALLRVRMPFVNACGDFTLMSKEDWLRVRGYAEWRMFSWHLDSLLIYQAIGHGLRVRRLAPAARIFHIDHDGGYTPEGAQALFERLKRRGTPFLTDHELQGLYGDIMAKRNSGTPRHFNTPEWGLAGIELPQSMAAAATGGGRG
jgi:hypothetical protein